MKSRSLCAGRAGRLAHARPRLHPVRRLRPQHRLLRRRPRAAGRDRVMEDGDAIGYGIPPRPTFWIGRQQTGDGFRETHIAFRAPGRAAVRAFVEAARATAPRCCTAQGLARVRLHLLRRVRPRPRRQQCRGGLPRPRVGLARTELPNRGPRRGRPQLAFCPITENHSTRFGSGAPACPSAGPRREFMNSS